MHRVRYEVDGVTNIHLNLADYDFLTAVQGREVRFSKNASLIGWQQRDGMGGFANATTRGRRLLRAGLLTHPEARDAVWDGSRAGWATLTTLGRAMLAEHQLAVATRERDEARELAIAAGVELDASRQSHETTRRYLREATEAAAELAEAVWIVSTPWLGNGYEAVIVRGRTEDDARAEAQRALGKKWQQELDDRTADPRRLRDPYDPDEEHPLILDAREHLTTIAAMDGWLARQVDLPHICEVTQR